ncbi:MAG: cysteine peptidase family C39 domain-containing protein, partial [Bacteroidales bacterium]|nr:cysteine peptidase family C39 domain-containing protein [Bacteroidales bacterium]
MVEEIGMWLSVKIKQQSKSDCGAASLASVAAHYGMRVPLAKIRLYSGTDSGGATLKGLVEAARRFGFLADGFKGEQESLDKIPKPAIIHLKKDDGYLHYVVLTKSSASFFHIMDPLDGEIERVPRETLLREWTGYLILLSPSRSGNGLVMKEGPGISLIKWIR